MTDSRAAAPIILFAFNRPTHLDACLTALAVNRLARHSHLLIHCDGPRQEADLAAVAAVRQRARATQGFGEVEIVERADNFGLARSITSMAAEAARRWPRFIVVEDDLRVSPHFLDYMNDALERFADDGRVGTVHGYMYPVAGLPEYFFTPGANSWGWATWRDRWTFYEADGRALLRALRAAGTLAGFDHAAGAGFAKMLVDQILGRNDSWAVRWHASLFLRGLLTLQPGRSFVQNIGTDDSGRHSRRTDVFETEARTDYAGLTVGAPAPDPTASAAIDDFFLSKVMPSRWRRLAARAYVRAVSPLLF